MVALIAASTLAGCATDAGNRSGYGEDSAVNDITGEWQLTKGSDADGAMVMNGLPVTLVISDTAVSGQGPCNVYGGDATFEGSDVSISTLTSTMMACEEEARMELETRYFAALEKVTAAKLGGGELETLTLTGPEESLKFTIIEKKAAN